MNLWRVKLFAYLRERHGDWAEVESAGTVSGVLTALTAAGIDVRSCRLAVNQEFAAPEESIAPGDDLALIPPVSGG